MLSGTLKADRGGTLQLKLSTNSPNRPRMSVASSMRTSRQDINKLPQVFPSLTGPPHSILPTHAPQSPAVWAYATTVTIAAADFRVEISLLRDPGEKRNATQRESGVRCSDDLLGGR